MPNHVSNCVQLYRNERGMTQEDLAEKVDVTRQTIIAIEKGNYTPSVLLALKLGKTLHKTVEEIFCIT